MRDPHRKNRLTVMTGWEAETWKRLGNRNSFCPSWFTDQIPPLINISQKRYRQYCYRKHPANARNLAVAYHFLVFSNCEVVFSINVNTRYKFGLNDDLVR